MKRKEIPYKDLKSDKVSFIFNDITVTGVRGQPIAVALMSNGIYTIRHCEVTGEPRGIYCGIGHCYECRATVNGIPSKRTCLTLIEEGMIVSSDTDISYGAE
ncbi:(2Fe-2S)-binding protein [Ureibacillus acetophenoni]|uniref:2Fe-2S iron-sulfur cluster protein n=1 Tax=Ureibacillus acetophenoni TaxID=614649 RepID=A0A285UQ69_9BACL|nr:(2Fe-2S)-binding protein [Ureibacillus acetophenoni]SOC43982.1 2Fe-2S iron-sulfur cluster protein [Ureibacillus acetophenoni]